MEKARDEVGTDLQQPTPEEGLYISRITGISTVQQQLRAAANVKKTQLTRDSCGENEVHEFPFATSSAPSRYAIIGKAGPPLRTTRAPYRCKMELLESLVGELLPSAVGILALGGLEDQDLRMSTLERELQQERGTGTGVRAEIEGDYRLHLSPVSEWGKDIESLERRAARVEQLVASEWRMGSQLQDYCAELQQKDYTLHKLGLDMEAIKLEMEMLIKKGIATRGT